MSEKQIHENIMYIQIRVLRNTKKIDNYVLNICIAYYIRFMICYSVVRRASKVFERKAYPSTTLLSDTTY